MSGVPHFMLEAGEAPSKASAGTPPSPVLERPPFVAGVFDGMPAETYHAIEALSQSGAAKLLRSPAHYIFERDQSSESTAAMDLGTAVHTGVLEPDTFESRVIAAPACDRRTSAGKSEWAAFVAAAAGRIILSRDDYDAARRCIDAVLAHPAARQLLDGARREVSLFWTDARYTVPCKARVDAINHGGFIDLKTTPDASPEAFGRSAAKWGYTLQAAHYLSGGEHLFNATPEFFVIIAAEKEPPYAVACYAMPGAAVLAGQRDMARAAARYADALASGRWQGYPQTIDVLPIPRWLLRFDN